ncbi:glycosyltransferase [Sphingobacterium sp. HJSM2_6]|uniref:glycosyltransferase n=1 Tax=Sphingobacterium sp. HJSM2_6 TaxID=3366264 RepID=UPI003BE42CDE
MKKILLLTTIYPSPDLALLNSTNVCHYFAKEWVKMGYDVRVIFNYPIYSRIVHLGAELLGNKAASIGQSYFITKHIKGISKYEIDGVKITRIPLYKCIPKIAVKKQVIKNHTDLIIKDLENDGFVPNSIVAHFCYPHLEMVANLKYYYGAKTAIVNHIQSLPLKKYIGPNFKDFFQKVDAWGFRSSNIKLNFEKQFGLQKNHFLCYSGVPNQYILNEGKLFTEKITKFIYVGSLIERKHPLKVLVGLENSKTLDSYQLIYVGEGILRKKIAQEQSNNQLKGEIDLKGNLPRVEVLQCLDAADCFIMISQGETFGLVYLEAMARGLITVASSGEGMDEIIVDGYNGFFCEAGSSKSLSKVIDHINSLSAKEKMDISNHAIETAKKFSDTIVAKNYLDSII